MPLDRPRPVRPHPSGDTEGLARTTSQRAVWSPKVARSGSFERLTGWLDWIVLFGLSAVAIVAPLAYGSVQTHVWASLALVTAGLLVIWSSARVIDRTVALPMNRFGWVALVLGLPLAWAGLQLAPWMPAAFHHPLWSEAARLTGLPVDGLITVDAGATRAGLARLGLYVGVGFLAAQLARNRRHARVLVGTVVIGAVTSAGLGLADALTQGHLLAPIPDQAWVTGTFVNRNHFATLAGLGLLAAVALAVQPLRGALSDPAGRRGRLWGPSPKRGPRRWSRRIRGGGQPPAL